MAFQTFFFFLICLSLLFPNINPYPLAARLCRNSWLQRRVKCKTCVGLSSFYPACLFLDSCRLIWSLGAQKREKSPIVTARSWARNVLEAGEEKKNRPNKKERKNMPLPLEQSMFSSTWGAGAKLESKLWVDMKNAPSGQGRRCAMRQGLLSGSSSSISDHQLLL